jgi:hypothetical protein
MHREVVDIYVHFDHVSVFELGGVVAEGREMADAAAT